MTDFRRLRGHQTEVVLEKEKKREWDFFVLVSQYS